MSKIFSVHDKFFKHSFVQKYIAIEFFERYLPKPLYNAIDTQTLKMEKTNFLSSKLQANEADVLFSANLKNQKEKAYLYFLVEHQRRPEKLMAFRVQKYVTSIMDHCLKQEKHIPLVVPFVVYQGKTPYPYSKNLQDIIDAPKELIESVFNKPFNLIEMRKENKRSTAELSRLSLMMKVMGNIEKLEIIEELKKMHPTLNNMIETGDEDYIAAIICYILESSELLNEKELLEWVNRELSESIGGKVMTLGERLIQRGRNQGIEEGIQTGIQTGMKTGLQTGKIQTENTIAKKLLDEGADLDFISKVTELSLTDIEKIRDTILETTE